MNILYRNEQGIHFRCWSRKAYAMFCSLGKYVTIGALKKGIADVSLQKQATICIVFSTCLPVDEEAVEKDKPEEDWKPWEELLQLCLVQPQRMMAFGMNKNKFKTCEPKGCVMHLFGFFIALIKKRNNDAG